MQYQVTLTCVSGKYKPVSTIVDTERMFSLDNSADKQTIINKGIEKICIKRGWGKADLKKYEYLKVKIRKYDKAKIEAENKVNYEKYKEQMYASGAWKRPKNK